MAEETGGPCVDVTAIEIAEVYRSTRAGIVFQRIATLTEGDATTRSTSVSRSTATACRPTGR